MNRDHTQKALDEYYATGIDPTGGDISDDLDEQEQAIYDKETGIDETGLDPVQGTLMAGLERLEQLVNRKIAEIDANEQDLTRIREFIATHEWHFAKTMPQIPHWYCLRKDKGDIEEFTWFAKTIREHSVPGQFYGKTYYYFYLDGYKYWWMDPTPEECDLINRDKILEETER